MQQIQKTIVEKCSIGILGTAWVAGLLIAGSDSLYMPWFNGVGLLLFFGASFLLGRLLNPSHLNAGIMMYPKFYQKKPKRQYSICSGELRKNCFNT
ncbi:MAG: hypothetical protein DRH34_05625 [Deltaproteobacteria bacterium]|nr:MAG: hypothetical protein DRH34_05625 [Deltaproteobacteria bacterium]RLC21201.1 MAG: hypothetical protein DRH93_12260 [Deltaproteobacteria bacterium]